jgi:hypothetical protein
MNQIRLKASGCREICFNHIEVETEKAILFDDTWIPRSIIWSKTVSESGMWLVTVPEWFAEKNGL